MLYLMKLECFLLNYKNTITLLFTLTLIIVGICTTLISFKSLVELKKNQEHQRWIFLKKTIIDLKNKLCEYQIRSKETMGNKKKIIDGNVTETEFMIQKIEKMINKCKEKF